jgi:hypothetical protein
MKRSGVDAGHCAESTEVLTIYEKWPVQSGLFLP